LQESGSDLDLNWRSPEHGLRSPLHQAGYLGNKHIVELLVKAGSDPNLLDANGQTALHAAAREEHLDIIIYLVEHAGIDMSICDEVGKTAVDMARKFRVKPVLQYLDAAAQKQAEGKSSPVSTQKPAWSIEEYEAKLLALEQETASYAQQARYGALAGLAFAGAVCVALYFTRARRA